MSLMGVLPLEVADFGARCTVVYAGWLSFKELDAEQSGDVRKVLLLKFWLIYAMIHFLEYFLDMIGVLVPWYAEMKLGFLIWCVGFGGADTIFDRFVGKALRDNKEVIDDVMSNPMKSQVLKQGIESIQRGAAGVMGKK